MTTENTPHNPIPPDHQLPSPLSRTHPAIKLGIVVVILLILAGVAVFIYQRHGPTQASAGAGRHGAGGPVPVTTAVAKTGNLGVYLPSIGTVTPVYTASITAQVTGVITDVHYVEGGSVKKGDKLIDIDDRPYAATLVQAQGILKRDQNLLAQAKMDLERYQKAWDQNKAIAEQMLQDQEKLVLQDEGTVENDLGAVQYDTVQVKYCHIASPFDGTVGLRVVDPGNLVQANSTTPLVVVTSRSSPITVVFTIPEDDIDQVVSHMKGASPLEVDAFDRSSAEKLDTGKLLTLNNQVDTTTGTVKARAVFPNKDNMLFPNQFVNTKLLVTTLKNVTIVPDGAIQHNEQEAFVYVIEGGIAHMQDVTVGQLNGQIMTENGMTQITGIKPGKVVANSGFERLTDKAKVMVEQGGGGGKSTTQPTSQPGHAGHHHRGGASSQPSEESATP